MRLFRQLISIGLTVGALLLGEKASLAEATYPARQIVVVMPGGPGGSFDIVNRLILNKLGERIGTPVVIENVSGAAGMLAMERGARSEPDGYHFVVGYVGALAANPWLYPKLKYDPVKDFTPIVLYGSISCVLAVPEASPIHSFDDLVATARKDPGKLNFASAGSGTCGHISGEMLKAMDKLDMVHVPYQTAAPASIALLAGQVDFAFEATPTVIPNIKAGKLRALAISSPKRSPLLPEVPTVSEFLPGFQVQGWVGLMGPAKAPPEAVSWLNRQVNEILKLPEIQTALQERGFDIIGGSPEDFAKQVKSDIEAYGKLIKTSDVKAQ